MDSSRSVTDEIWAEMTRVVGAIVVGFTIGPGVNDSKVAFLKYGREVFREFDFANNTDKDTVVMAITNAARVVRDRPGGTVTPDAINECVDIFEEQGRPGVPHVIMVFSDGVTHYSDQTDEFDDQQLNIAVNRSIDAGTINYAVYFSNTEPERAEMESMLIAGKEERSIFATTFDELKERAIQELSCGELNGVHQIESV